MRASVPAWPGGRHAPGDRDRDWDWDWDDRGRSFKIEEATIADIQEAIQRRQITTTDVVKLYLERIKAYNGTCVNEPQGILGPITMIPHAGKVNALMTLNLRPQNRVAWGFDARKARSQTDAVDTDPRMPDALETAARLDQQFARTGRLAGPLHGAVFSIKDQYDTFDMRTTSGADAFWANDRPPDDATVVARLRAAGAIILAKANNRIGVIREYMNKSLFNAVDTESIDLVDRAVGDLRRLGATIVDPGPTGALFQSCVDRFVPKWLNQQFTPQWPAVFPADEAATRHRTPPPEFGPLTHR